MSDDEEAGACIKRRALGNVNTLNGNISADAGAGSGKRRRNDAPQCGAFSEVLTSAGLIWSGLMWSASQHTSAATAVGYAYAGNPATLRLQLSSALDHDPAARNAFQSGFADFLNAGTENLQRALLPLTDSKGAASSTGEYYVVRDSLVKVLLKCDCIQPAVIQLLLEQLPALAADSSNSATSVASTDLPRQILSQMRWLDHLVDAKSLTDKLLECLEVLPLPLQRDLIGYLPEVVEDSELDQVVNALESLQQAEPTLLVNVLDAYSSLPLPADTLADIVQQVLSQLSSVDSTALPVLVRFLLESATAANMSNVVNELRQQLRLSPTEYGIDSDGMDDDSEPAHNNNNHSTTNSNGMSQLQEATSSGDALTLEALTRGMQFRSDIATAFLTAIQKGERPQHHCVMDIWVLFCLHSIPEFKSKAANCMIKKVAARHFTESLLSDALNERGDALSSLFYSTLGLADTLVRSSDSLAQLYGTALYILMFKEFKDPFLKSEVALAVMAHAGAGASHEIDCALAVLSALAEDTVKTTTATAVTETSMLQPFASLISGLLNYMGGFSDSQMRAVFTLMFRTSVSTVTSSDRSVLYPLESAAGGGSLSVKRASPHSAAETVKTSSGMDEVHIFIRKQLNHGITMSAKRVGIIGAVAMCVHQKEMGEGSSQLGMDTQHSQSPLTEPQQTLELLFNSSQSSTEATAFLHEELTRAVSSGRMDKDLSLWIGFKTSEPLADVFAVELENGKPVRGASTLFCGASVRTTLRFNLDGSDASISLHLVRLLTSSKPLEKESCSYLSSILALAAACQTATSTAGSGGGSAATAAADDQEDDTGIDGLLGCPMLLPDTEAVEGIATLQPHAQAVVFTAYYHSAQWCRALVSAFVVGAEQEFRRKIVRRLEHLCEIESDLLFMLKRYPEAQVRGEVLLDMKHTSTTSTTAATAAAGDKAKGKAKPAAAATKKAAGKGKAKAKVVAADSVKGQDEDVMRKKIRDSMQPLSPHAILVLGFPEMRGTASASSSDVPSSSSDSDSSSRVSFDVVRLLLEELVYNLNNSLPPPKKGSVFGSVLGLAKSSSANQSSGIGSSVTGSAKRGKAGRSKYDAVDSSAIVEGVKLVQLYLDGGVFAALNAYLHAMARGLGVGQNSAADRYGEETGSKRSRKGNHRSNSSGSSSSSSKRKPLGYSSNPDERLEDKETLVPCFQLLLQIVRTVCTSSELQLTPTSQRKLKAVLGDICGGGLTETDDAFECMFEALQSFAEHDNVITDFSLAVELVQVLETIATARVRVKAANLDDGESIEDDDTAYTLHNALSTVCLQLLRREWSHGDPKFKYTAANLGLLVRMHIKWAAEPLAAIQNLAAEVLPLLLQTDEGLGPVVEYPPLSAASFVHWYSPLLSALVTAWTQTNFKNKSLPAAALISRAHKMVLIFKILIGFTKGNATLEKKVVLLAALKEGHKFVEAFLKTMPFLEASFKEHQKSVLGLLKDLQSSTRQIQSLCLYSKLQRDPNMSQSAPAVRRALETIVYKVKALSEAHGIAKACKVNVLKNRHIDGSEVQEVQESEDEEEEEVQPVEDTDAEQEEEDEEEED